MSEPVERDVQAKHTGLVDRQAADITASSLVVAELRLIGAIEATGAT